MTLATFSRLEEAILLRSLVRDKARARRSVKAGRIRPSEAVMEIVTIDRLIAKVQAATER